MKVIIADLNSNMYNVNLTEEQVELVKWMAKRDIIYNAEVIDEMKWEDIE